MKMKYDISVLSRNFLRILEGVCGRGLQIAKGIRKEYNIANIKKEKKRKRKKE